MYVCTLYVFVCVHIHVCAYLHVSHNIILVDFSLFSLMAPLAKDQYAWNNQDTTLYVNILSAAISIISVGSLLGTKYATKW